MTPLVKARAAALLALLLVVGAASSQLRASPTQEPAPQTGADISPEALAQIDALIREKESRSATEQKLDSQLIYELKMRSGAQVARGVPTLEADVPYADDGHAVLDVRASLTTALTEGLAQLGAEILSSSPAESTIRIHIGIDRVPALAALPDVVFVQPRQDATTSRRVPQAERAGLRAALARSITGVTAAGAQQSNVIPAATGKGSRSSEGDLTHLAVAARAAFRTAGAGIKIGVLSDGVRSLAASQASGDLGPVTVIGPPAPCAAWVLCDEGTAMLEIIHDLAPGAELYFASGMVSITSFADNIRALRAAGCDIIVDDLFYFVETPFQDGQAPGIISNSNGGVVIQAVKDVTASGALYFSSAGNSGNFNDGTSGAWEGDFVDGGPTKNGGLPAGRLHSWSGQNFNLLRAANVDAPIVLYWSDPLGGSANDYDLFRLNSAGTAVSASSTNIQNGTQDPIEQVSQNMAAPRIVIVQKAGAQSRFLHLETNRGRLQFATRGVTHGHAAVDAVGAFGVAATPAAGAYPKPFGPESQVETFSSDGPRRIFFEADGTAITPDNLLAAGGKVLQKPDFTAADGVSVSGAGGFQSPFYGTSAAAPHAAAIAALLISARPGITPEEVRAALMKSAIDIEAAGFDQDAGAGIIMANETLLHGGAVGTAALFMEETRASDNPGNGNGAVEAGEGAGLAISLSNRGVDVARAVSATLTSRTIGITIVQPSTTAYGDIAVSATAVNTVPLTFTVASDFPCPRAASFELTVTYDGATPQVFAFDVTIGPPSFHTVTTLDTVAPASSPGVSTATGVQNFRLFRDTIPSACGTAKPAPGISANGFGATNRQFDAYTFDTCAISAPNCVTVTLQADNGANLFAAAYSPVFNPGNIVENYLADAGGSAASHSFSFELPAGAQRFAIDVHDVPQGLRTPSGSVYSLSVAGACLGACNPPNRVPVARAKNVIVAAAGDACGATDASVDDGSSDEDGDALTVTQSPAGPYPAGTTAVLLTVVDPSGATSQATATVTVVDQTPPAISCPAPITVSTSPGTCSAPVVFAPTASDVCSPPVSITSTPQSGSIFAAGVSTVTATARDAAGNSASCPIVVTVVDNEAPAVSNLRMHVTKPRRLHSHDDDCPFQVIRRNGKDQRGPKNHGSRRDDKVVDVTLNYELLDNCGASCVLSVHGPRHASGKGSTSPDWTIIDDQHVRFVVDDDSHAPYERYELRLTCTDAAGNKTLKETTVWIPDRR
jgi:hypothetical protein